MKVRIFTLGCKVNQFESQAMLRMLEQNGYEPTSEDDSSADISILNSCAVTAASETKAVKLIHRIRRESPATVICLTGCMAQTNQQDDRLSEVDIIFGNKKRADVLTVLNEYFSQHHKVVAVEEFGKKDDYEALTVDDFSERTRAFLKIEDGCNRFCSYCIIPYARGRVRSCSLDYISNELKTFSDNGYREVVMVGINLSSYGSDIGLSFADAVRTACTAAGLRIRLGSLEPESMDMPTLEILAQYDNFCPQFHLSLQSGCDATLKRMNRHYSCADYEKIVNDIRTVFENPAITTDVMVGFAGETDEEFAQSVAFIEKIGFAKVHIFPYSRRPGTAADRFKNQISADVKKKRAAVMAQAAEKSRKQFLASQLGRIESVLVETRNKDGRYEGYTMNYTPVYIEGDDSMVGNIINVRLTELFGDGCLGVIV